MTDKQFLDCRLSCWNFLQKVVAKLLNKTSVQYALANNLVFPDARLIADIDKNKACLKSVCCLLVQCNRVIESEVKEILRQYSEYANTMFDKERDRFVNFDPARSRVDSLLHETLAGRTVTVRYGR